MPPAKRSRASPRNQRPPFKVVSGERLQSFWADYDTGGRRSRRRHEKKDPFNRKPFFVQEGTPQGRHTQEPVWVTPTVLGVVRTFYSAGDIDYFLERVGRANRVLSDRSVPSVEFQPLQILGVDRDRLRLVERAYRGPSIADVLDSNPRTHFNSLYGSVFWKKMMKKYAHPERMLPDIRLALTLARAEISLAVQRARPPFWIDQDHTNFVVLDYNPRTKKPLIAVVDHGGSKSTFKFRK